MRHFGDSIATLGYRSTVDVHHQDSTLLTWLGDGRQACRLSCFLVSLKWQAPPQLVGVLLRGRSFQDVMARAQGFCSSSVRLGSGLVWLGLAWLAWFGSARLGLAGSLRLWLRLGLACIGRCGLGLEPSQATGSAVFIAAGWRLARFGSG